MTDGASRTVAIERFVPADGAASLMAAEHVARYRFACQLVRGRSVLDAACGSGYGTAMLARAHATIVAGIDVAGEALPPSGPGLTFTTGDLRSLPFSDGSFDCVVCFEAIEHVTNAELVISEFARVLRSGGLLVISTPNRLVNPPGNPYHLHEYIPEEFRALLRRRFAQVTTLAQHPFAGSFIEVPHDAEGTNSPPDNISGLQATPVEGVSTAKLQSPDPDTQQYTIALASDEPITWLESLRPVAVLGSALELRFWHEQLDDANRRLDDADRRLQDADRRLEDAGRRGLRLKAECRRAHEQVRLLGARLLAAEQDNADFLATRAELTQLQAQITAAQDDLEMLRRERDAILASTSWRMTKPGRHILGSVREHVTGLRS